MTPKVSIIILNYRTADLIKYQLQRLFKSPPTVEFEVIVVDNNSEDKIQTILQAFPQVIFVAQAENRGYAAGNNAGIGRAQGKYLLIINPDVIIDGQAIDQLVSFMTVNPTVGIAGPRLEYPNGELQESCSRWPTLMLPLYRRTFLANTKLGKSWLQQYLYRDWDHQSNKDVDWLFGACLIVSKDALLKVGLLDENFFLYLEDTDWCRRFWLNGYRVTYHNQARVVHYHKRSSAENDFFFGLFSKSSREHIKSFIKYLRKYRGQPNPHLS